MFIDRHLPKSFRWLTKTVRVDPFLLTHEIVEKALLDELRLHYLHAHQIALRAERDAVKAAGVPWWIYQRLMKKYEKPIEEEKLVRVPPTSISRLTRMRKISACYVVSCVRRRDAPCRMAAKANPRPLFRL